jgi:pilus assembly protein Flp/PilA
MELRQGRVMGEGWRRFFADQSGATAVEYAVMCAFIFLIAVAAITGFAGAAGTMFNNLSNAINNGGP